MDLIANPSLSQLTGSELEDSLSSLLKNLSPKELELLDQILSQPDAPSFNSWLKTISPGFYWDWTWQLYVQAALQRITDGLLKKLMLFVPPRHGKSEMVTVRYPVYRMALDPRTKVIIGAYNQSLADKFSRKARRLTEAAGLPLNKSRYAVSDWETRFEGGIRAVGVGGGITGQGGNLIVVDDPVKSREEAESETYRERVYDWYTDDLYTRREPGGAMILIMTRWHEQDLAGKILESEDADEWEVISLPAEAEENDPLGRAVGEALCPERFTVKDLENIKSVLQLSYYALYQQVPQPKEGSLFKEEWFKELTTEPTPGGAWYVRYWDNAATHEGGDYTVGVLMSLDHNNIFTVEDVIRGQWSPQVREAKKLSTAFLDRARYGRIEIWNEQEPGSAGKESAAATIKNLAGYIAFTETQSGSKAVRAEPYSSQLQAGNVKIRRAPWNAEFIKEHLSFPVGKHDDQVDAASGAFNKLYLKIHRKYTASAGGSRGKFDPREYLIGQMNRSAYTGRRFRG